MNISANSVSLKVTNSSPVNSPVTAGVNVSSVNSISSAIPSTTPQVNLSGVSSQTPMVANPTYEKPTNKQINNVSPQLVNQTENGQQTDSAKNIQQQQGQEGKEETTEQADNKVTQETANDPDNQQQFTEVELKQIGDLKLRDSEVLIHERAHSAVGGQYAGSPSYSYQTGPDGVKYAVSGEVSIDTSRVPNDPQATLQKAQQIKAAALAPSEPSGQDRRVAAKADQMAAQARSDILQQNQGNSEGKTTGSTISYESSVAEHFSGMQELAKDSDLQQKLNSRIQQINSVYQNSSITKASPTFQTQI